MSSSTQSKLTEDSFYGRFVEQLRKRKDNAWVPVASKNNNQSNLG